MSAQLRPVVGDWYLAPSGETFEVIAYDPEEESVEIQYFDGSLEELDLDSWLELEAEPAEPPEDFSGSLDLAREDYGYEDRTGGAMFNPLDELDLRG